MSLINYKIPLKIFNKLTYKDFKNIYGVNHKTASIFEDIVECMTPSSYKDIENFVKIYNKQNNKNIKYNFLKNNIIKMKNGNVFELIYIKK
jgi:hypothetical protein